MESVVVVFESISLFMTFPPHWGTFFSFLSLLSEWTIAHTFIHVVSRREIKSKQWFLSTPSNEWSRLRAFGRGHSDCSPSLSPLVMLQSLFLLCQASDKMQWSFDPQKNPIGLAGSVVGCMRTLYCTNEKTTKKRERKEISSLSVIQFARRAVSYRLRKVNTQMEEKKYIFPRDECAVRLFFTSGCNGGA